MTSTNQFKYLIHLILHRTVEIIKFNNSNIICIYKLNKSETGQPINFKIKK